MVGLPSSRFANGTNLCVSQQRHGLGSASNVNLECAKNVYHELHSDFIRSIAGQITFRLYSDNFAHLKLAGCTRCDF